MLKIFFDLAIDPLGLPISAFWEYIILTGIGYVAYRFGWDCSPGGPFGSLIHWVSRLVMFVFLWAITYALIAIIQWIIANWVITMVFLVTSIIFVIAAISVRRG